MTDLHPMFHGSRQISLFMQSLTAVIEHVGTETLLDDTMRELTAICTAATHEVSPPKDESKLEIERYARECAERDLANRLRPLLRRYNFNCKHN